MWHTFHHLRRTTHNNAQQQTTTKIISQFFKIWQLSLRHFLPCFLGFPLGVFFPVDLGFGRSRKRMMPVDS
jgi:hypothetical protein